MVPFIMVLRASLHLTEGKISWRDIKQQQQHIYIYIYPSQALLLLILPTVSHDCCVMTDHNHLDSIPMRQRESVVSCLMRRARSLWPPASKVALWRATQSSQAPRGWPRTSKESVSSAGWATHLHRLGSVTPVGRASSVSTCGLAVSQPKPAGQMWKAASGHQPPAGSYYFSSHV